LFLGLGSADKLNQYYACLYGVVSERPFIANIPDAVVIISMAQTAISAVLIFLFLLAVRNHFRIK
jgi:hypothetical protein